MPGEPRSNQESFAAGYRQGANDERKRIKEILRKASWESETEHGALDDALHEIDEPGWIERRDDKALKVYDAQQKCVCRICGERPSPPFVMNYGAEHAHAECLRREKEGGQQPPSDRIKVEVDPTLPANEVRIGDVRVVNLRPPSEAKEE